MALLLVCGIVGWIGLCLIAVGLCMSAQRGDAELGQAPLTSPRPATGASRRARRLTGRVAHSA